jgi:DAACS family dicarboxylate/amino acid:cation (Na+ or H+) symporter
MVFAGLVLGVVGLSRGHGLPGVASRTLVFTVLLSSISVLIGMTLTNIIRPGESDRLRELAPIAARSGTVTANAAAARPLSQVIVEMVPRNPVDSAARALDGEMLPLMIFALVFGVALSVVTRGATDDVGIVRMLEQVFDVSMVIVHFVMRFAPIAVFAIVFGAAFTFGTALLAPLFLYVVTVVGGLAIQQFVVYSAFLRAVARRSPLEFFRAARAVYLYAFSTASSNATLPLSLKTAVEKLHLSPDVSRFALTVGSTANQNGTALFEGVTVLFLAQVYALDLTLGQQVYVMFVSIIAGIGTAGVPGGSLPMVLVLAQSVGVPAEGMALVLGVDRFLDMCRTAVNVSGDLVIAALVDRAVPVPAPRS